MSARPIAPTVSIRGTSRDALERQTRGVLGCLRDTLRAMSEASPDGRDYSWEGLRVAEREYMERRWVVARTVEQYEQILGQIVDQGGGA